MSNEPDPRLVALSTLLLIERDVRRAESLQDLRYIMVNDTHRLVAYRQAFVWEQTEAGGAHPVQASGVSELEANSPMVLWLGEVSTWLASRRDAGPLPLLASDAPESLRAGWHEFAAPFGLLLPLVAPGGRVLGGLFLAADAPWNEGQVALLERLADAYAHAWKALQPVALVSWMSKLGRNRRRVAIAVAIILLLPVRQYVLAPAEVVAVDPVVVAAPMSGVVSEIDVKPNATVAPGTLLFTFEDTDLANEVAVAQKAFEVAEAEYLKNAQDAFACDTCRGRVPELQARMEKERAQMEWTRAQLERSRVVAPVAGVAVFSDPNEWRGRPVSVGERVMILAQPEHTRLRVSVPVADAIAIEPGTEVVFYLNVNPLDSYDATVAQTSYEATLQPDQTLGYVLFADFTGETSRLGLRGTAKVYGSRAPILMHVLRRPISWLRRTMGI